MEKFEKNFSCCHHISFCGVCLIPRHLEYVSESTRFRETRTLEWELDIIESCDRIRLIRDRLGIDDIISEGFHECSSARFIEDTREKYDISSDILTDENRFVFRRKICRIESSVHITKFLIRSSSCYTIDGKSIVFKG